jgi:hypothetical protein
VVFFIGDCEFKTPMPANVMESGLSTYIRGFQTPIIAIELASDILHRLREHKLNCGLTTEDHLDSLERRHASHTTCPRCGGQMVQRTAKGSGKQFLGCSNFPKCRHTVWQ